MRIVFAGTPDTAVPSLERLVEHHEVVAVVTRPDAPRGRKRELTPSAVATRADELGIPLIKTSRFTPEVCAELEVLKADIGVVVAYGALIPEVGLRLPRLGWLNLHFSKLPHWRGAAPLQFDIINGATCAHMTVFQLVAELDAGDIYAVRESPLGAHETAGTALRRLSVEGASLLVDVLSSLGDGSATLTPQDGESSYAPKLTAVHSQLLSQAEVTRAYNLFRGVTPEPGAWIESTSGRVKVLECAPAHDARVAPGRLAFSADHVVLGFSNGALTLSRVQPAGKSAMSARDWVRGIHEPELWSFE